MNLKSLKAQLEKQAAELATQASVIAKKLAAISLLMDGETEAETEGFTCTVEGPVNMAFTNGIATDVKELSTRDRTWNTIQNHLKDQAFNVADVIRKYGQNSKTDGAIYWAVRTLAKEGKLRPVAFNEKGQPNRYMIASGTDDSRKKPMKTPEKPARKPRRKTKQQPTALFALRALVESPNVLLTANEVSRHIKRVQKQRVTVNAIRQALTRLIVEGKVHSEKIGKTKFIKYRPTVRGIEAIQNEQVAHDETESTPANATRNTRELTLDTLHSRSGEWSAVEVQMHIRDNQHAVIHPETIRQALNKLADNDLVTVTRTPFGNVRYTLTEKGNEEWRKHFQPSRVMAAAAASAEIQ